MTRGFSRIDLVAVLVCAGAGAALAAVALGRAAENAENGLKPHALTLKDGEQLRLIHQTFIVFANEAGDNYPRPGFIKRLPVDGRIIPGRGPEDISQNTTANLFSMMVIQNFFNPELPISPVDRNPNVREHDSYDYTKYNPVEGVYWDDSFSADLTKRSHVSYAHMPIHGPRATKHWRSTMDSGISTIGNRGPRNGEMDPKSYTCGPHGNWAGFIVGNDNALRFLNSPIWNIDWREQKRTDNVFLAERDDDTILAFTRRMTQAGPELQFD
jgi:hypothetical protein